MPTKRRPSKVHRENGPYLPLGLIGAEYCVKCRQDWPCDKYDKPKGINDAAS